MPAQRAEILVELAGIVTADDGDADLAMRQHPGQRHLGRRFAQLGGYFAHGRQYATGAAVQFPLETAPPFRPSEPVFRGRLVG